MTTTSEPRPASARPTTSFAPLLRRLPHNVDAEMALLGAILLNNRAYERVSDFLRPEHFVLAEHARVFDACSRTIERGQIADPVTLKGLFEQDETLGQVGGVEYLTRLADCAATPINAGEYGRLVYDLFLRRELIALGEDVVNRAYSSEIEERADQQIEIAEQGLLRSRHERHLRWRLRGLQRDARQRAEDGRGGAQAAGPAVGRADRLP